ncbi:MAG: Ig-like domain-containing protein [Lachnospiraceae bacterium]|nr:Ig-like domain-containing protein [Lachnospiraceae bacterium]
MKWKKILTIIVMFALFVVTIGEGNIVFANTKVELANLSVFSADEGDVRQSSVTLRRNGKIQLTFDEDTYGHITIVVSDSNGTQVYNKSFSAFFDSATYTTGDLAAGDYKVAVIADSSSTDFNAAVYAIYIPDSTYPEFDTEFTDFTLLKGKSEKLKIYCEPAGANYTVRWSSEDSSIASVSQDGTVKAKKKGTTTIYADISTAADTEYEMLIWNVTVKNPNPSFSTVSKKMKGFKQKKTKYELIKKNKKAVLYGGSNVVSWKKQVMQKGYGYVGLVYPYMELTKKSGKTSISLKFRSDMTIISIYRYDTLGLDTITFKSGNTSVHFDYSHSKEKRKVKDGVTTITNRAFVSLSKDNNENVTKLNKLLKVLRKKKVAFRAYDSTGEASVGYTLGKETKKNWIKFIKNYKKLLEIY